MKTTEHMPKFTPGPWHITGGRGKKGELYVWTDRDEKGKGYLGSWEVCVATVHDKIPSEGQCDFAEEGQAATAALIAAAPEMYEHAMWVVRLFGTDDPKGLIELKEHVAKLRESLPSV